MKVKYCVPENRKIFFTAIEIVIQNTLLKMNERKNNGMAFMKVANIANEKS